jgi:hypothetical protein
MRTRSVQRSIAVVFRRSFLAAALCLVVAGCVQGTGAPPTTSQTAPTPAQATDTKGRYQLVFELPRTDWKTTDSITGLATLSLIGSGGEDFGSSGSGPIGFGFDEVGGSRHVGPLWTADCAYDRLVAGQPRTSQITKSGGLDGQDPNVAFYRSFFADPLVHLPAGDWTITAVARFVEGTGCSGESYTLKAAVLVHVTTSTAGPTMVAGPVNGQLFTAPNGGHVACQDNLPCGPDPVATR